LKHQLRGLEVNIALLETLLVGVSTRSTSQTGAGKKMGC